MIYSIIRLRKDNLFFSSNVLLAEFQISWTGFMALVDSLNRLIIQEIHLIKLCILRLPQRLRPRKLIDIYNMNTKKTETFFFSFSLEKPFFLLPSYYTECGIFLISTYFKNFSYISSMCFSFHPTRNLLCRGKWSMCPFN